MLLKKFNKRCFLLFCLLWLIPTYGFAEDDTSVHYFLSLADIHFNPYANCKNQKPCPFLVKLQRAPLNEWALLFAQEEKGAAHYRQDTNFTLLHSTLTAASQVAQGAKVDFVLVLGDFLAHNFRESYKLYSPDKSMESYARFVRKIFEFLDREMRQAFPDTDVFSVIGNNDSFRGDYATSLHGPFFPSIASLWFSNPRTNVSREPFNTAGYYAVNLKNAHLRLVALNTNLFSTHARAKNVNVAALSQLKWLQNQFESAQKQNQKILLAMHIPPGIDLYESLGIQFTLVNFWEPAYTAQFQNLLKQYGQVVAGIFAGHLHTDSFELLAPDLHAIPSMGTPSISPIFGNDPGFKLYAYSRQDQKLLGFVTYLYSLDAHRWPTNMANQLTLPANCRVCFNKHAWRLEDPRMTNEVNGKWASVYWCGVNDINLTTLQLCH